MFQKRLEHMKSTKYHYHVLMIKDLLQMMRFIHQLIFVRTEENRFSQIMMNKKRFLQTRRIQKILTKTRDSHRRSQNQNYIIQNYITYRILHRQVKGGTLNQYCILRLSGQFWAWIFFYKNILSVEKHQNAKETPSQKFLCV